LITFDNFLMALWKLLTLLGLALNLLGVILLFFYVLPRRQRTGGTLGMWEGITDQSVVDLERRWDLFSAIGLWCVIIGIALQAVAVWIAP